MVFGTVQELTEHLVVYPWYGF